MKKEVLIIGLILLPFLSGAQKPMKLFNGKNLKGWTTYVGSAKFNVEDGAISGMTTKDSPSTYLAYKKNYTNFILEYEIKLGEDLNAGVQIRSSYDGTREKPRVYGSQIEADDSERNWNGGIYDQSRNGWRYNTEAIPEVKTAYKKGAWNKVKVIAAGNRIATWLNGVNVANLYEEKVETGFIALQVHSAPEHKSGRKTYWRNITIKEIPENYTFETTSPVISYLNNELTKEEKAQNWKLLWDGKTSEGWRGAKKDHFPEEGWTIKDGLLSVEPSGGGEAVHYGDIVTTRPYKNFILEVDFKFAKGANSGIKYFVDTDLNKDKGSAIGCEFQILDDELHPDAKAGVNGNRTIGSLYDLIKADAREYAELSTLKYVNENWNRARIIVEGNHVEHWLNGSKVVEYTRNNQQWNALVAYSKYANWKDFGNAEEGLILLQDHGDKVDFRNIKIKELK